MFNLHKILLQGCNVAADRIPLDPLTRARYLKITGRVHLLIGLVRFLKTINKTSKLCYYESFLLLNFELFLS